MNQVVFNFHDAILLMTSMLCLLFAVLLICTNSTRLSTTYFLAAFLLVHAFIPLNELILWGAAFKIQVREFAPYLNFSCGFAYYLDSALLFLYVRSLVFRHGQLRPRDALHLLPLLIYLFFMLFAFYRFPNDTRTDWVRHETLTYSHGYVILELFCRLLRSLYCVVCLHLILRYRDILAATRSNIQQGNILWLKLLVIGFLIVTLMEVLLSLSKIVGVFCGYEFQHARFNLYEIIGLTGYYAGFLLVNSLIFSNMRYFVFFERVKRRDEILLKKPAGKLLNPELGDKIDSEMRDKKPYLNPDLTLDMLARHLRIPARDLSLFINRYFSANFWEFINGYRIEEAKRLLAQQPEKTVTDIYLASGFSSKSVFNTFFKKHLGLTPTEFRRQLAAGH